VEPELLVADVGGVEGVEEYGHHELEVLLKDGGGQVIEHVYDGHHVEGFLVWKWIGLVEVGE